MRKLYLLWVILLVTSGCNDQMLSDANGIGETMVDIAPIIARFNPVWAAGMAVVGTTIIGIVGVLVNNKRKANKNRDK